MLQASREHLNRPVHILLGHTRNGIKRRNQMICTTLHDSLPLIRTRKLIMQRAFESLLKFHFYIQQTQKKDTRPSHKEKQTKFMSVVEAFHSGTETGYHRGINLRIMVSQRVKPLMDGS